VEEEMAEFFIRAETTRVKTAVGSFVYGKRLSHVVSIRRPDGSFIPVAARFDTGSEFTVIPTSVADRNGVVYSKEQHMAVKVTGTTGDAIGYPGTATLRFDGINGWEIALKCLFVEKAKRMLIGLPDQLNNFDFSSTERPSKHGVKTRGVLYELRQQNHGTVLDKK